jgi:hypothetical protein
MGPETKLSLPAQFEPQVNIGLRKVEIQVVLKNSIRVTRWNCEKVRPKCSLTYFVSKKYKQL